MAEDVAVEADAATNCLVAIVDIRGFSAFAHDENDPTAVARYVAATAEYVLERVRDSGHLAESEIKLLGDGLLFILKLEGASRDTMASAARIMLDELVDVSDTFGAYLRVKRPAGLSAAPTKLGIGVAYGALVRLKVSAMNPTIALEDFVGHPINMAARLQELARLGGCVVHEDVYEKLLKHSRSDARSFLTTFGSPLEVRLPRLGSLSECTVFSTAVVPDEFQKAKADEEKLESLASRALVELRETFRKHKTETSAYKLLPETTRFILFRRDGDRLTDTVTNILGQRISFRRETSIRIETMKKGQCPVADAVLLNEPVVVHYSVRYDECPEDDPENEYWRQTRERFPNANVDVLKTLSMHPASILAIPLVRPGTGELAVAVFDSTAVGVFNDAIADEMLIKLGLLYEQVLGWETHESEGSLEL